MVILVSLSESESEIVLDNYRLWELISANLEMINLHNRVIIWVQEFTILSDILAELVVNV